jgi:hypothetical protein
MELLGIAIGFVILALTAYTLDAVHSAWQRSRSSSPWQTDLIVRYASPARSAEMAAGESLAPAQALIGKLRQAAATGQPVAVPSAVRARSAEARPALELVD